MLTSTTHTCSRLVIIFSILLYSPFIALSQSDDLRNTELIDSLISKKAYNLADSVLTKNIEDLKTEKLYEELTKRIYYYGKIALQLNDRETAITKTKAFANSISSSTDSLNVLRQKHLVLGRFYVFIRDYKSAANENSLALEVTHKMPNATGDLFGLIHHNLSIDYRRQGNIKDAIYHSKKSLEYYLSYPNSDKIKVLDAYNSLGARMWDVYKIDSALYYFKKGEKIIDDLPPSPFNKYYHRAKTQSNISSVYAQIGNISEASQYNEKAIKNYNTFINSDSDKDFFKEEARLFMFMTIQNYADDFIAQGNYTKARELNEYVYKQQLIYMPDNDYEISYSLLNLGNIYLKLQDLELAESYFEKGLQLNLKNEDNNKLGLADAYYYKGVINDFYGNIPEAMENYELSKVRYESIFGNSYDDFYLRAMQNYSMFYSKNGYHDKAIEMAKTVLTYILENQGKTTKLQSTQLINLAKIYFQAKNYDQALKYTSQALELYDESDEINGSQINNLSTNLDKPAALLLQSKIILEQGDNKNDKAKLLAQLKNLKQAISILEKQKSLITEDENLSVIIEENNTLFEYTKSVYLRLFQLTGSSKYLEEILSLHESKLYNRIRQELNIKTSFTNTEIPKEVLEQESSLTRELKESLKDTNTIESFITANNKWENFLETLKANFPKYYNLKYASISKTFDLSKVIKEGQSLVRYMFIDDELFVFILENNTPVLISLDTSKLHQILEVFESDQLSQNETIYHDLYKVLWSPIEEKLTNETILIIPDRDLFNLSFETFTTEVANSNETLFKYSLLHNYCISYNYSLLLVDKEKTPKYFEKNFIAFSPEFNDKMKSNYKTIIKDSVFLDKSYLKLLPQPFAKNLAKEYSKVFNGTSFINENASKQIFTKRAKEHKIIHIGTHAESNNVSPELSRLIFAKNMTDTLATDDNSLYTFEIYNQNLSSNLAILTACETGKPTYQAGEGMISLAHAFNYAGSESMLTSLWKIDEQSSAEIIENFYDNLKLGLSKNKALQYAKLDYLASAEGRKLAPQYWAGLVLIGDTSPIAFENNSGTIWYWLVGIVIFTLILYLIRNQISRK